MPGKRCQVCSSPMTRYENPDRWVCTNVKAHAKAERTVKMRGLVRNPRGINQTKKKWLKGEKPVECSLCENGKRRPKRGCRMCRGKGWLPASE